MKKKVLVLGGTGAIGIYLVPELLSRGFQVDVTTRSVRISGTDNLNYIHGDAHNLKFLRRVLRTSTYDVVVDFMNYSTDEFRERYKLLLKSCRQYMFLSSYRVFADVKIITEHSPRLLDVSKDTNYLQTDDYALAKARQEDMLRSASSKNWTIVRPAITYSRSRFQLCTLEADTIVWRALQKKAVILPRDMLGKITTMTWAGDVARLLAKLILNKKAYGDDFNLATKEHHTWSEVVAMYKNILSLKVVLVSLSTYINAMGGGANNYQVKYDRMYDRVIDNSKILKVTGETQKKFTPLHQGLERELAAFIKDPYYPGIDYAKQAKFDRLTHEHIDLTKASPEQNKLYWTAYSPVISKVKRTLKPRTRLAHAKQSLRSAKQKTRIRTRTRQALQVAQNQRVHYKTKHAEGAILTLSGYYNYGNIIQRYALQEFLRKHGHQFVSYWQQQTEGGMRGTEFDRFRHTAKFVKKRILLKKFDVHDNFPTYIVGSDQVWRNWEYDDEKEELGYYFFNFIKNSHTKLIAYAVSFGKDATREAFISPQFIEYAKPLIKRIDYVSMRESTGVALVQKTWGIKAEQVVDPTMLLTVNDYNTLINRSPRKLDETEGVFSYMLAMNDEKEVLIKKIKNTTKMPVYTIHPYAVDVLPAVEQWLQGFRNASFVITDSFHGTVFSIINNTSFVVIENTTGGLSRLVSLLKRLGLEGRIIKEEEISNFELSKLRPIDWGDVNHKVERLRKQSADWLLNAVTNPKS